MPALFLTNLDTVVATLGEIIDDSVHLRWTRQELVDELAKRGYQLRQIRSPELAGPAIQSATDEYLNAARRRLIGGKMVSRPTTPKLLSRIEDDAGDGGFDTDSVITGGAGSGKTASVVDLVERLLERGIPTLVFRLDRVPPSAWKITDLAHHLGLEESPALVLSAASEAVGRPGVLIVDQLDAVSAMSGRSSGAFDLVDQLLREARGSLARTKIHTVVVCRAFDWKNDPRLRRLVPDSHARFDVTEFTVEEVTEILANATFDPDLFKQRQLELLRLPQNLSLFLDGGFDPSRAPALDTATKLFGRYWDEKRKRVSRRLEPILDEWRDVITTLCKEMTSAQQLSVIKEKLDVFDPKYLGSMVSEGVLTFDDHRYGFGHESFFDYCFARLFSARSESLTSFLKTPEQHLFRRAQVRQVLTYLRDADTPRYIRELRELLSDDGIRAHIKDLVIALLAEVTDPTDNEWGIWGEWTIPAVKAIEEGTSNKDELSAIAWRRVFASRSWFDSFDRRGVLEGWLESSNNRLVELSVTYLHHHQRHSPDRVAALLEPYADRGGDWASRFRRIMALIPRRFSRRYFELFLHLIDNGTFDDASDPDTRGDVFLSVSHALNKKRPELIPDFLAHRLRRRIAVMRANGIRFASGTLVDDDYHSAEMFDAAANAVPDLFVKRLLPILLEVSEDTVTGQVPPKTDSVWPALSIPEQMRYREGVWLTAMATALGALARDHSADLSEVIVVLRRQDTHTANHLLLRLYSSGKERYAEEAISLLSDQPWRLNCWFSGNPNWCAMELISATVSHCSPAVRHRLEAVILDYTRPWEQNRYGIRDSRQSHFNLLSAIPTELHSPAVRRYYQELKRKFGEPVQDPPTVTGGWVRSPITKVATDKMTDDQWLRAIAKYDTDHLARSSDPLKGGAYELSGSLEARAKEEPERFARLSLRFPSSSSANPLYMNAILSALVSSEVAAGLKTGVCHKAFADSRIRSGRGIADVLGAIDEPLTDEAVAMLHHVATEHQERPNPKTRQPAGGDRATTSDDIYQRGINTTRGRAAEALHKLILSDPQYVDRFRPTIDRMTRDPSPPVLSCVAGMLGAVSYHDPNLAMLLFKRLRLSDDRLFNTPHVYDFIRRRLWDSLAELRPIVERMLHSSIPEVSEAGGRLAGLAALHHKSGADLAAEALGGTPRQRLGIAQVSSQNIGKPVCREWCEEKLGVLFNDEDPDVRREAAGCFGNIGDHPLEAYGDLILLFCDSSAFSEGSYSLLRALEESVEQLPGMTCDVCERFVDRFADEARDARTGSYGHMRTVATLVFRTYQQHQNDEWTSRALDLIDRLCLERAVSMGDHFAEFDR